mgnify:CR=1 FL=1
MKHNLEVCFSPALYELYHNPEAVVVVVDILRATSAICTAFMNGARHIIPVGSLEEARDLKEKGHLVAAERDGIVLDFADFGNSPYNFTPDRVRQNDIVYSTTNGTNAIHKAAGSYAVGVGAYLNLSALAEWVVRKDRDVVILCAAWKDKFSLEDSLFAGALASILLQTGSYSSICDSVRASLDLWEMARPDVYQYILKAAQKERLAKNGLDDVIEFCHTPDLTNIVPFLKDQRLEGDVVE